MAALPPIGVLAMRAAAATNPGPINVKAALANCSHANAFWRSGFRTVWMSADGAERRSL